MAEAVRIAIGVSTLELPIAVARDRAIVTVGELVPGVTIAHGRERAGTSWCASPRRGSGVEHVGVLLC